MMSGYASCLTSLTSPLNERYMLEMVNPDSVMGSEMSVMRLVQRRSLVTLSISPASPAVITGVVGFSDPK